MAKSSPRRTPGLLERLTGGPVICAEGYLFELERRGYLQAGAFVPEVVLEHPEEVKQLHREFVHPPQSPAAPKVGRRGEICTGSHASRSAAR